MNSKDGLVRPSSEWSRLHAIHCFRTPSLPTCFAWCAAAPRARLVTEYLSADLLVDDSDSERAPADSRLPTAASPLGHTLPVPPHRSTWPCSLPSPLPAEAQSSEHRGFTCAGVTVTRAVWSTPSAASDASDASAASSVTSTSSLMPYPMEPPEAGLDERTESHDAPDTVIAPIPQLCEYVTLTLSADLTPGILPLLLEASAWWLTRAPCPSRAAVGAVHHHVPVLLSVHGAAAFSDLLTWLVATTGNDDEDAPVLVGCPRTALQRCFVSLRLKEVDGASLRPLTAPSVPVLTTENASLLPDAWSAVLQLLPRVCPALVSLRLTSCEGWSASWWTALLWGLLPRLTELRVADMDVSPRIVPLTLALFNTATPATSVPADRRSTEATAAMAEIPRSWPLRCVHFHTIRGLSTLSFLLLAHLFVYRDPDTTNTPSTQMSVAGWGRVRHLRHLTIENCDVRPIHIEDEARLWVTANQPLRGRDDDETTAYSRAVATIRAASLAALPHALPGTTVDLLRSCPELQTLRLVNLTGRPLADPAALAYTMAGAVASTTALAAWERHPAFCPVPSLTATTFLYSTSYPLSTLLLPRNGTEAQPSHPFADRDDSASAVVRAVGTEVTSTHTLAADPWSALVDFHSFLFYHFLTPPAAFAVLERVHLDTRLPFGPRLVKGVTHSAVPTFWRRLSRALNTFAELERLRLVDVTIYLDDSARIPLEDLYLSADGVAETALDTAHKEGLAASEVGSLSWLRGSTRALESLQLVNIFPLSPAAYAGTAVPHVLTTFPRLRHVELRCISEALRGALPMTVPPSIHARDWRRAAVTHLTLHDTVDEGALIWHADGAPKASGACALSRLAMLRSLRVHCALLALPLSALHETDSLASQAREADGVCGVTGEELLVLALPSPMLPFPCLARLALTGFTSAHAALLCTVPCYPRLSHVDITFARTAGKNEGSAASSALSVDCLRWLAHAPQLTHVHIAGSDATPDRTTTWTAAEAAAGASKTSVHAPLTTPTSVHDASAESWWACFFAPVLTHPHVRHVDIYGFAHLP